LRMPPLPPVVPVSAAAAGARFPGPLCAAGAVSGPFASDDSPPVRPDRLVPKPIAAATATGTARSPAPTRPRGTMPRRHSARHPLRIDPLIIIVEGETVIIVEGRRAVRQTSMRFNPSLTARLRIGFVLLFALLLLVSLLGVGRLFQIRVDYENDTSRN